MWGENFERGRESEYDFFVLAEIKFGYAGKLYGAGEIFMRYGIFVLVEWFSRHEYENVPSWDTGCLVCYGNNNFSFGILFKYDNQPTTHPSFMRLWATYLKNKGKHVFRSN